MHCRQGQNQLTPKRSAFLLASLLMLLSAATVSAQPIETPTATPTCTPTATPTCTETPTVEITATATPTVEVTNTAVPTATATNTVTVTSTPTATVTNTPQPTQTPLVTPVPVDCELSAIPSDLWPPNHKFVEIGFVDGNSVEANPTITGVFQDEPTLVVGSGNFCPDARIDENVVSVRAERTGNKKIPGDGRVYHIQFTLDTISGPCSGEALVCVPHDQGAGQVCVDGGALYDSLTCPNNKKSSHGGQRGGQPETKGKSKGNPSKGKNK